MGEIIELKNTEITEDNNELVFLTPMDVSKIIGCSVQAARELLAC